MDPQDTIDFSREALTMVAIVGGPILAAGLVIGLIVGIFQAMTQIQDQTVSAVPKMLGMLLVTIIVLPWVGESMMEYTRETLSTPRMGGAMPVAKANPSPFTFASATTRRMPDFTDGPVARIANFPPAAMPAVMPAYKPTMTMPTMRPQPSSMPIHPYGQSPEAPAEGGSSMPQLRQRALPQAALKPADLEG